MNTPAFLLFHYFPIKYFLNFKAYEFKRFDDTCLPQASFATYGAQIIVGNFFYKYFASNEAEKSTVGTTYL